ncbi:hypothetical protein [Tautonia plasticadhaerens]|uniref:hypothetical protein n=1 Tax=Tautonia plasticadhaerens TaxID=2527974 RepID=UPI00119E7547|nr:hypothetical protein [Tautonia plasticadhaerens]
MHPDNPRYFIDGSGRAVYLTGSHTWDNLVDMGRGDPTGSFDFDAYLDFLDRHGQNFFRLWTWIRRPGTPRPTGGTARTSSATSRRCHGPGPGRGRPSTASRSST